MALPLPTFDSAIRLCFGSSTFVAGRLSPRRESSSGLDTLRLALDCGVRLVHSNPKLETQWAIRRVLDGVPDSIRSQVLHMIKAEAPLEATEGSIAESVRNAVCRTREMLGIQTPWAVVFELDLKRSHPPAAHGDKDAVCGFYAKGSEAVLSMTGGCARPIAFVHCQQHLRWVLEIGSYAGVAAMHNLIEPWSAESLEDLAARGLRFYGVAPLFRGRLTDHSTGRWLSDVGRAYLNECQRILDSGQSTATNALRWAAGHSAVSALMVTCSRTDHLLAALTAIQHPCSREQFGNVYRLWESLTEWSRET